MADRVVAGVDIGGTNTKVGFVDEAGAVRFHARLKTDDYGGAKGLVDAVARVVAGVDDRGDVEVVALGIGAPNGNHRRGTVEEPPNLPWPGVTPLAEWLSKATGVPAVLDNDANAAALGEHRFGAARGLSDFLFVTLGTGLGSGLVVDGALVRGHSGFAGELGHVIVEPGGRRCGCGRDGCLEQYASATGLARTYRELSPTAPADADAHAVYERAVAGDRAALGAFEAMGQTLGVALANAVAYTSPEAIFLFGGVTEAGSTLFEPVRRHFQESLLSIYRGTCEIRLSGLPEGDAAILGAASLGWGVVPREAPALVPPAAPTPVAVPKAGVAARPASASKTAGRL